jgi:hypothetical protein
MRIYMEFTMSRGQPLEHSELDHCENEQQSGLGFWLIFIFVILLILCAIYDLSPMMENRLKAEDLVVMLANGKGWDQLASELRRRGFTVATHKEYTIYPDHIGYVFFRTPFTLLGYRVVANSLFGYKPKTWSPFVCTVTYDASGTITLISGKGTLHRMLLAKHEPFSIR